MTRDHEPAHEGRRPPPAEHLTPDVTKERDALCAVFGGTITLTYHEPLMVGDPSPSVEACWTGRMPTHPERTFTVCAVAAPSLTEALRVVAKCLIASYAEAGVSALSAWQTPPGDADTPHARESGQER